MRALKWGMALVVWLWLVPAAMALPRAVIVSGPPATTTETAATFTFAASASGGLFDRFECRLDGAGWSPCASPYRAEALTGGSHEFHVRLTGLFTDPTPASARWLIEALTVVTPRPLVPGGKQPPRRDRDVNGCANAAAFRTEVGARVLERATLCLLNHERSKRGLRRLRSDSRLAAAARRHAEDMATKHYFAHVSPAGGTLARRVASTGYLARAQYWALGEVLAWTPSEYSSPRIAVRELMRSKPHRKLILDSTFTEAGVGVVKHAPVRNVRDGATFVGNFGRRTY